MATEVTHNYSPSKNWKKYWRYASSTRNYCPNKTIKVSSPSTANLSCNYNLDIQRIDTGYVGSHSDNRKSQTFPECSCLDHRHKFHQQDLSESQKHGCGHTVRVQANVSKDPGQYSRKRPAENISTVSPLSRLQSSNKLKQKFMKLESGCKESGGKSSQKRKSSQERKSPRLPNQDDDQCRPKILRLQEKYCMQKIQDEQLVSKTLRTVLFEETEREQSQGDNANLLRERDIYKPLDFFNNTVKGTTYEDEWKKSLRPSLSDVTLPRLHPDTTIALDYNQKGNINILGKGVYGFVVRTELEMGEVSRNCVIKFFRPSRSSRQMIFNEARILHYLASTGAVPKVFGVLEVKGQKPAIAQECFADGQDLYSLMNKYTASKQDWIKICLNAAECLLKIHSKQLVINDIKPDNILADNSNNVRFIDMGMATLDRGMSFQVGPVIEGCDHVAPECRKGEESSFRSDIFSFGDVLKYVGGAANIPELTDLSKLLTCAQPFQRINIFDTIRRLKELQTAMEDLSKI